MPALFCNLPRVTWPKPTLQTQTRPVSLTRSTSSAPSGVPSTAHTAPTRTSSCDSEDCTPDSFQRQQAPKGWSFALTVPSPTGMHGATWDLTLSPKLVWLMRPLWVTTPITGARCPHWAMAHISDFRAYQNHDLRFLCVHVCVCICWVGAHVCGCPWRPGEGVRDPEARVIGYCEPLNCGFGD